jgi:hypothetical protein
MTVMAAEEYKHLKRLGVEVRREPCSHVLCRDLDSKLTKAQRKTFSVFFGIQTCLVVPEGPALYAWDVEDVLARMFEGRKQGSQLLWD